MDDAKNLLFGVMQTLKDRFGNPLISSFVISWCLWNNQILIILFSSGDGGWRSKLEYINHTLYPSGVDRILDFLIAPLLFSVIWIYLLPSLLSKVAIHHERTFNENRENLLKELEKRPLSEEDRKILLERMLKESNSFLKQKEDLSASYLENQVTIAKLEERITNADGQLEKITVERNSLALDLKNATDRNNDLKMQLHPVSTEVDINRIDEKFARELLSLLEIGKRVGNLFNPNDIVENRYINVRYPIIAGASIKDKKGAEAVKKDDVYDQETIAFLLIISNDANIITSSVTYDSGFYTTLEKYGVKNINNTLNNLFAMNFIGHVNDRGFTTTPRAPLTGLLFSRLGFSLVLDPESTRVN